MRVTITPPAASGAAATPFLIADDSTSNAMFVTQASNPSGCGGLVTGDNGFVPTLTQATQRDELIGSNYAQELPRGNAQTTWTFIVNRQAVSVDIMFAFLADHPALVPTSGTLTVTIAATMRYLKNAVLKDIRCVKQKGTDFAISYTFSGSYVPQQPGATAPASGGPWTPS